jgi:hypothetical protein
MRKTFATLAVTAAAFAVPMLGAGTAYAETTDGQLLGSCSGTPIAVDGYGVCVSNTTVPVYGGGVFWTPGVPKQYVNTPAVGPVPAQAIGTPIVPSQGVTVPAIVVQGPTVTPCLGGC